MSSRILPPLSRRFVMATALAGLAAPRLARAAGTTGETGAGAPVTLRHRWGETTVPAPPKRVVTLSYVGVDLALALGVRPVGLRFWFGTDPRGLWPWSAPLMGDAQPAILRGDIDPERIAALKPDLIEGMWSGMRRQDYDILSRIAPVIPPAPGENAYSMTWSAMTRMLGRALSRDPEPVIAPVEAAFSALRQRHPDWSDRTAILISPSGPWVYGAKDIRGHLLTEMGLRQPDSAGALFASSDFFASLPQEELHRIDADAVLYDDFGGGAQQVAALPLRRFLRAYREGREILVPPDLGAAMAYGSPLSLPMALKRLEPLLVAALDGDRSTPVSTIPEEIRWHAGQGAGE